MEKKRDPVFDVAKAFAMFMVVYSHVMFYRPGFNLKDNPSYSINFIMVVAMPLFFMISGYFSRRLHESGDVVKLLNRFISYFWPLAIFALVFAVVERLVSGRYLWSQIPLLALKKFLFCGWFFYTLAVCELIVYLWFHFPRKRWRIPVCLLVIGGCLCGVGRVWHMQQIVAMLPFYAFGLWLFPSIVKNMALFRLLACIGGGTLFVTTFLCGNIAINGLSFYWNYLDVFNFSKHDCGLMIIRFIIGTLGAMSILKGLQIMLHVFPMLKCLSTFGVETLGIYFIHGYLVKDWCNRFVGLDAGSMGCAFSAFIVFVTSFVIVKALKFNSYISHIVWGYAIQRKSCL